MGQVLHGSATTTEAIRRAIQNSEASLRVKVIYHNRSRLDAGLERQLGASWLSKDDLLRAELDMLKRAFRRHCVETA